MFSGVVLHFWWHVLDRQRDSFLQGDQGDSRSGQVADGRTAVTVLGEGNRAGGVVK